MALNVVVDLSHHNGNVDLAKAKAAGLLGVIHKATQGRGFVDPLFAANRTKAAAAGLLWGAYHFGVGGAPVAQATHFLESVKPGPDTLLALDFEANPAGPSMSLDEARSFVTRLFEKTGRWPGFYSGHYIKDLLGQKRDPVLVNCWLWLAQYGPKAVVQKTWPTWTFWQYTDGALGLEPHDVPGIGRCDRDRFNGSEARFRRLWGLED